MYNAVVCIYVALIVVCMYMHVQVHRVFRHINVCVHTPTTIQ